MRKLIMTLCVLALMVGVVSAEDVDWRVKEADQEVYVDLRVDAKAAFAAEKYEKAATLFLALADTAHCERFPAVKACQLNSAAYSLILANRDKKTDAISEKVAKRCLEILTEARLLSRAICGTKIDSNIEYCEYHLR